jgi:hypothetical protein
MKILIINLLFIGLFFCRHVQAQPVDTIEIIKSDLPLRTENDKIIERQKNSNEVTNSNKASPPFRSGFHSPRFGFGFNTGYSLSLIEIDIGCRYGGNFLVTGEIFPSRTYRDNLWKEKPFPFSIGLDYYFGRDRNKEYLVGTTSRFGTRTYDTGINKDSLTYVYETKKSIVQTFRIGRSNYVNKYLRIITLIGFTFQNDVPTYKDAINNKYKAIIINRQQTIGDVFYNFLAIETLYLSAKFVWEL